jgi:EAL domain-containing protein (putative c-di-GMP-specific phosphodiesterase class I)/FixJ family two-component response regulator
MHLQGPTQRIAYVLDDDPKVRASVLIILNSIGYDALGFSDTALMLAKLEVSPCEVIVLDLTLGQSDAVEVIHGLAEVEYDGKVLLISGHGQEMLSEIQRIGKRHGLAMLPSLRKPFRAGDLKSLLITPPQALEATATAQQPERNVIDLEEAIRADWLELWYQPKIDLRSSLVSGAEALLRARHPKLGIVPPSGILPPAGDPIYHPLSKFVIQRAMTDWLQFADAGVPVKMSVNIPVSVITADGFVNFLRSQLPSDQRFPGLIIEVTEDEAVKDPTLIHEVSTQLKLYNVGISIDDFGQAHSSFSRLIELPCVELKLDRSYVSSCSSDPLKHALCQTVIDLAHRVGSQVCAEGVEQPEDLRAVIEMGCDTVQGYIFAKPMQPDVFIDRVKSWPSDSVQRLAQSVRETQLRMIDPAPHYNMPGHRVKS